MQFEGAFLLNASYTLAQPRAVHEFAAVFHHGEVGLCVPKSLLASLPHHEALLLIHSLYRIIQESVLAQQVTFSTL